MPRYHIYQSNSLAGLIEQYPDRLLPPGLFDDSFMLIVQNRNMGEWMKLELARRKGICADFHSVIPEKGLREFCKGYPSARALLGEGEAEKPVLFLDNLKLILFKTLEILLAQGESCDPVYRELFEYVRGGDPSRQEDVSRVRTGRLYELADSIAGLFYHYGMNCRDLIGPWERGEAFAGMPGPLKKHEAWQRALWNRLFHPDRPYLHLSRLLSEVMARGDSYDGPVKRVALFGSSFLGDTGLQFFSHLSRDIHVDHFILSPSRAYSRGAGEVHNPLLKSWSTLIGGFAALSEQFEGTRREERFVSGGENSLLGALQQDLLDDRSGGEKTVVAPDDASLRIHTFTSPWREIAVLKDLILSELNSRESLKLTDICILAPDINEYAPFLEALFPSLGEEGPLRDHLPYNVIDLAGASDSPYIQGFLQLFALPGERFTRRDLFVLFDTPCFRETFRIDRRERDFWLDLCEELNIKWGMNGAHKRQFYPEATDFNSWEEGFRRLEEGFFLEEEDVPGLPFGLPDEAGNQSAGKLISVVENLFHDLYELNRVSLPLEQWILLAESLMESYLTPREGELQDEADRRRLKGTFRDLLALAEDSALPEEGRRELDFTVFRILLTEFIRKSGGGRGRYLTQGITCSSLKPLRAIPFKRIYVLGLDEKAFPGEDQALSFDLREVVQQTIDLSRRGSDKYAFLETLLAAEEGLTLFYHDRDPLRGEALQPSPLLGELLEYLDRGYRFPEEKSAAQWLVRREAVHDYDPRYFNGEAGFRSFSASALKSARTALRPRGETAAPSDWTQPPREKPELVTLRGLEQFLRNPAAYYFQKSLGIYLDEEDHREEDSEENWEFPFLERYRSLSRSLTEPELLGDEERLREFLADRRKRGALPDSDLIFLEEDFFRERLGEIRSQLEEKNLPGGLPAPRDYLINPEELPGPTRREDAPPPRIIPGLGLPVEGGGVVRTAGLLEEMSPLPEEPGLWATMEYCEAGQPGARHYLKAYLKALFLPLLPEPGGAVRALRLYQVGKRSYPLLHFLLGEASGELPAGTVALGDPRERLGRLVRLFRDQQEAPLMVYPELGDSLAKDLAARPDLSDRELLSLWERCWERTAAADGFGGFSPFVHCPYRQRFLRVPPETDPQRLRELLETVYLPFHAKEAPHAD